MKLGPIAGMVFVTRLRATAPKDWPRPDLSSLEVAEVVRAATRTVDAVLSGGRREEDLPFGAALLSVYVLQELGKGTLAGEDMPHYAREFLAYAEWREDEGRILDLLERDEALLWSGCRGLARPTPSRWLLTHTRMSGRRSAAG